MTTLAARQIAFERRTAHDPRREYRRDFTQLDNDTLDILSSDEASAVTPSMLKVYVRLQRAMRKFQEREGVLWIRASDDEDGKFITAWKCLIEIVGVANSTAKKALDWMSAKGIIRYEGYKNGYGIRIFFNRAKNSIGQKNLLNSPVPSVDSRIPLVVMPFNKVNLDKVQDVINRAPDGGENHAQNRSSILNKPHLVVISNQSQKTGLCTNVRQGGEAGSSPTETNNTTFQLNSIEIATTIAPIVEQAIRQQTERGIKHAISRIRAEVFNDTQTWLDTKGIPKAVRVAVRETFNYQRKRDFSTHGRSTSREAITEPTKSPEQELHDSKTYFAAQLQCVRFSLEAGRTPEQIKTQFSLDDATWKQIMIAIGEHHEVVVQVQEKREINT